MKEVTIREIGVPVRSVNRAALYPAHDAQGVPRILGTMSQQAAAFFLLVIDPRDGSFKQLSPDDEGANYTTAVFLSRTGRLYIGAAHNGQLYCYDPAEEALLDLGTINPGHAPFPCRIDEDSRGRIWISSFGTADLTRYDPDSGTFTRYGRLDETDMYAYCYVNTDDTIASLIMQTRPHVVVLDPESGKRRAVGPSVVKGEGRLTMHRGRDGKLYIESSEGNFRIDGMDAIPVSQTVAAEELPHTLSDGTSFRYADAKEQIHRNLEITAPDGSSRTFHLDYDAAGTDIFCLFGASDGRIYGSSVLPEHFFQYDPGKEALTNFGVCSEATGEAYSMAELNGKIYVSSYPAAMVSEYDPTRPYSYGANAESNPRELGRIDDISYRPRTTLAGPGGKVWLASVPDYGMWGGPLAWYDPATGEKKSYHRICGDGSCFTMAWLVEQEVIAVGTTIQGGSGTKPKVDQAVLFLFDYTKEEKIWEGSPDKPVLAFTSQVALPNGRIIGTTHSETGDAIFTFDAASRTFEHRIDAPEGGVIENGLQVGPDGMLYGLTRLLIYRIDPASTEITVVARFKEPLAGYAGVGPMWNGELYYAAGHRLMAAKIL